MRKKHPFHCDKCHSECMIYKKGKGHRVLVCPICGVLATNGLGKTIAKIGAKTILKSIPGVGTAMAVGEGLYDVYGAVKGTGSTATPSQTHTQTVGGQPRLTTFDKALLLEKLERTR